MNPTVNEIAKIINIRQVSIRHFCSDFKINLFEHIEENGYFASYSHIKIDFANYLLSIKDFLFEYDEDYYSDKSVEYIAKKTNRSIDDINIYLIKHYPHYYNSKGIFTPLKNYTLRYISSYQIDFNLGKDYSHILWNSPLKNKSQILNNNEINYIIGYEDVKSSIIEQLEPILNPDSINDWGLNQPGGILLFGPPGCGKTFWANNIAQMLGYEFYEIPRSIFGSNLVDGAMLKLKELLTEINRKSKVILFFDEFDSIASARSNQTSGSQENIKVVNTLLQEIPKLIQQKNLIIAATNFIDFLDPAVIRPGRFDLKIPIFNPNTDERISIIINYLYKNLTENSRLKFILEFNKMSTIDFWLSHSQNMVLFSNSMVIDFTQLLKRRIKSLYYDSQNDNLIVPNDLIELCINETSAKLTNKDAEIYAQFFNEVKSLNTSIYDERLSTLFIDLQTYFGRFNEPPPQPIGFRLPNIN